MKYRVFRLLKDMVIPVAAGLVGGLFISNLTLDYLDKKLNRMIVAESHSTTAGSIAAVGRIEKVSVAPYVKKTEIAPVQNEEDAAGLTYTDEESQMLLKIAMAEAEDQGVIGKALVMNVVHNRMMSDKFPSSIEEVIFQENQFTPILDGRYFDAIPDSECYEALEMVLNYWDGSNGALYFEVTAEDTWHSNNLEFLFAYGDMSFYR